MYAIAVRSVLLRGYESWSLRAENVWRILVSENRYLHGIRRIWWENFIRNSEVKRQISVFMVDFS